MRDMLLVAGYRLTVRSTTRRSWRTKTGEKVGALHLRTSPSVAGMARENLENSSALSPRVNDRAFTAFGHSQRFCVLGASRNPKSPASTKTAVSTFLERKFWTPCSRASHSPRTLPSATAPSGSIMARSRKCETLGRGRAAGGVG